VENTFLAVYHGCTLERQSERQAIRSCSVRLELLALAELKLTGNRISRFGEGPPSKHITTVKMYFCIFNFETSKLYISTRV
jgi:hypothetical protein